MGVPGFLKNIKLEDVTTGIAKAGARITQSSMDATDKNVSRLSQLRLTQAMRNQELDDKDVRDSLKIINDMEGKLGSIDAATYLIQEYGFSEAQKKADELVAKQKLSGGTMPISEYIGLEESSGGKITALELANFVTPTRGIPTVDDFGDPGIGLASTMFGYGKGMLKKRSDSDLIAIGIDPEQVGRTSVTDIPEIKARGLYEWQVYSADSPGTQAGFLQTVINRLQLRKEKTTDPNEKKAITDEMIAAKLEQDVMIHQSDYLLGLKERGPISDTELSRYNSNFMGSMAKFHNLSLTTNDWVKGVDGLQYTGASLSALQRDRIESAFTGKILPEIDKARRAGVSTSLIYAAIDKSIRSNRTFTFNSSSDDDEPTTPFSFSEDEILVNINEEDAQGDKVFPGLPATNTAQGAIKVTSNISASNPNMAAKMGTGLNTSPTIAQSVQQIIDTNRKDFQDKYKTGNTNVINKFVTTLLRNVNNALPQGATPMTKDQLVNNLMR